MELNPDIFETVMLYLPLKDMVRLSTAHKASRALLYSQDFMRKRATIMGVEAEGLLERITTRFPYGENANLIPYLDAHGRFHDIRLDFLLPFNLNAREDVTVEASDGGYILYSTSPWRRLPSSGTDMFICNPFTFYRTVLPRHSPFQADLFSITFQADLALMSVTGTAHNIRYRIALLSLSDHHVIVTAYDSANPAARWRPFRLPPLPLARANFQSLLVYKPRAAFHNNGGSCIWVLDLQDEFIRAVRCPQGFQCSDVFIDQNNRIISLGVNSNEQGSGGGLRFSYIELQLDQRAPYFQWTYATLAQESARLNYQLAREPAYSIDWEIFRARSLNSLLFRRKDDFAIYNIAQGSWNPFNIRDAHGFMRLSLLDPDMYIDFRLP